MAEDRPVIYSVRGPKNLLEMHGHDFEQMAARTDLCLVPTGSVEQHGAHVPLGTDVILAGDIARRIAARLESEGLPTFIAPSLPFGTTPYLADQPGTVTIASNTLKSVIKELCFSLNRHGIRRFVFILGHSGNQSTMLIAGEEVVHESDSEVIYLNSILTTQEKALERGLLHETGQMGHGGESETSRIMATHPELVDLAHAGKWYFPDEDEEPIEHAKPPYVGGGFEEMKKTYKDIMPYGFAGDPALSTAETGEALYDIAVDWCCRVIKRHYKEARPAAAEYAQPPARG